jgi:predicted ATP-grasp superfamily ATP-dependent carboligase
MPMTYEQVLQISKGDPEIAAFIMGLLIKNAELVTQVEGLELQVKELKRQLSSKSNNSSKPPPVTDIENQKANEAPAVK